MSRASEPVGMVRAVVLRTASPLRKLGRRVRRSARSGRRRWLFFRKQPARAKLRILLGLAALEDRPMAARNELWPMPAALGAQHVRRARLFEHRVALLEMFPTGAVAAEMGCHKGNFSAHILDVTAPRKLHLIDYEAAFVAEVRERYAKEIEAGVVEVHHGDTVASVDALPPGSLDWAYIDGDHSYRGAKRDLAAAHRAVKPDGWIGLNDYVFFNSEDMNKYGVVEAVHEFCLEHDWEILGFGLAGRGQHDVLLRRRGAGEGSDD
jgi:hypothetical protein